MLLQYASLLRKRSGRSHAILPRPQPPRVEAGSIALLWPERLLRRLAICKIDTHHYSVAQQTQKHLQKENINTTLNKHEYKHTK